MSHSRAGPATNAWAQPAPKGDPAEKRTRLAVDIRGAVQGVGFRPFVYRLAREFALPGWVLNNARGVHVEVEGLRPDLERFLARLEAECPQRAIIFDLESCWKEPLGFASFEIRSSDETDERLAVVLADGAICTACMAEVDDPTDRRYRYPFTNCTACGPRFSIVTGLPYDRPLTTMCDFELCDACREEYENPLDRRFHAQPNACPACGPQLSSWTPAGEERAQREDALQDAARALRDGRIVAAKGLGGFHLLVDAGDAAAVARLRRRKAREEKPLALMVVDLEAVRRLCHVPDAAAHLLSSPEAPIVLLERESDALVAANVAPGNPTLGVMLPYTALHHLLLRAVGRPLVATSGNLTDEPICTSNEDALARLGDIADLLLVHDRPIARPVDDSVVVMDGTASWPLRRSRGYAPLPVRLAHDVPPILALGGHLKNTVAVSVGEQVFLSQHIGDLDTPQARAAFEAVIADLLGMYRLRPEIVAHDLHPDYASTRWLTDLASRASEPWMADLAAVRRVGVQHHHAHLAACLAEHGHLGPALGVTWDGTGYGTDGRVWGGEFLLGDASGYERVASLRPFRLLGGEAAVREPRRSALALAWALAGSAAWETVAGSLFTGAERAPLERMLSTGLQAPETTSAGRLFDGVAALLGLHPRASYEGQAAMALQYAADPRERGRYPMPLGEGPAPAGLDWEPMLVALLSDQARGVGLATIAGRFHETLVAGILLVAERVESETVVLTGGCFQNVLLLARAREVLEAGGFCVLSHRVVPPGDGGLSLGQVAVAAAAQDGV